MSWDFRPLGAVHPLYVWPTWKKRATIKGLSIGICPPKQNSRREKLSKFLKQVKLVPIQEQGELSLLELCKKENGRERVPLQQEVQMYHKVIQLLHPQHLPLMHQLKLQLEILMY
ncbi:unnamed protein product [Prunus armeniaca]|uniref:Uncharacterized protein n=1 Tax=Prunus armeniaca TaxID=36596 RepID=A0A6J5VP59_PRUAR|nr:unnamed protein product [Prunus armeniaca]CAB4319469.1 unnamed protein product [Prunus armeniaca]